MRVDQECFLFSDCNASVGAVYKTVHIAGLGNCGEQSVDPKHKYLITSNLR
jgi:hypothetical protein